MSGYQMRVARMQAHACLNPNHRNSWSLGWLRERGRRALSMRVMEEGPFQGLARKTWVLQRAWKDPSP